MTGRGRYALFLSGVIAGAVGTALAAGWTGALAQPAADPPPQPVPAKQQAEVGRYQISAWGVGQIGPNAARMQVAKGA